MDFGACSVGDAGIRTGRTHLVVRVDLCAMLRKQQRSCVEDNGAAAQPWRAQSMRSVDAVRE